MAFSARRRGSPRESPLKIAVRERGDLVVVGVVVYTASVLALFGRRWLVSLVR